LQFCALSLANGYSELLAYWPSPAPLLFFAVKLL
jgi:hypothetical protein